MQEIGHLAVAIEQAVDPLPVMQRVVQAALALVPAADGAVVELADGDDLVYVAAAGGLGPHVGTRLRAASSLSGLAVREHRTIRCDDTENDERVDRVACRRVGARSMICVPLTRGSHAVGVLKVSTAQPNAFDEDRATMLGRLADFISAAIGAATDLAAVTRRALSGGADPTPSTHDNLNQFMANVLAPGMVGDSDTAERIHVVLAGSGLSILLQPIVNLTTGRVVGAEALSRFGGPPNQPPDVWFAQAHQLRLGVQLELAAARAALALLPHLPPDIYLSVNIGPEAILTPAFAALVRDADPTRIVIELTEHDRVSDYEEVGRQLHGLRRTGVKLAIDDTGSGFASFAHILKLAPDLIKLDRVLTTGIDLDPIRRALAGALVTFAADSGARVIAEGIENNDELTVLTDLGIGFGQGYHLGRPAPLDKLITRCTHYPPLPTANRAS